MTDKSKKPGPDIASSEVNILGTLLEFHQKAMTLLRQSSLSDDQIHEAGKRIGQIYEKITADIKRTNEFNLAEHLKLAYEEVEQVVAELSGTDSQREREQDPE